MAVKVEAGLAVRLSVLGETEMSTVAERKCPPRIHSHT
jgi:hypothetical protein